VGWNVVLLSTPPLISQVHSSNRIRQECNRAVDTSQGKYRVRVDAQRFIQNSYWEVSRSSVVQLKEDEKAYFGSTIT
jgi:hypothetical protein